MSRSHSRSISPSMQHLPMLRKPLIAFLLMMVAAMGSFPASAQTALSHEAWGDLLETYVVEGSDGVTRVDYGALKDNEADRAKLDAYIAQYSGADIDAMERDERFAAWANLYNAVTVRYIVEKYPVGSIKPWYSTGPWKSIKVEAGGETLSLHAIEHDVLRVQWSDDPRLHYAINCASYSCPNLRIHPWVAETLNDDLDDAARDYVNHPRGVRIENDKLTVSSIYEWFKKDFGGSDAAVIDHLRLYAEAPLAEKLKGRSRINDHEYDWSLNDAER